MANSTNTLDTAIIELENICTSLNEIKLPEKEETLLKRQIVTSGFNIPLSESDQSQNNNSPGPNVEHRITQAIYDEVPQFDENIDDKYEESNYHDYSEPNSKPAHLVIYQCPTEFKKVQTQQQINSIQVTEQRLFEDNRTLQNMHTDNYPELLGYQVNRYIPKTLYHSADTDLYYNNVPIEHKVHKRIVISDYDEVSDFASEIDNASTLPFPYDKNNKEIGSMNPCLVRELPHKGSNAFKIESSSNQDEEDRKQTLFGRYPALKNINDIPEDEAAFRYRENNKRTSKTSLTSCVPPSVDTPTGSIIDTTKSFHKMTSTKRKYDVCLILMAIGVGIALVLFAVAVIGYAYIGIQLEMNRRK